MQTNFKTARKSSDEYVESNIRVIFGGMQPMIATGKVTWQELKYADNGDQVLKFGLNCGAGVGIRDDGKTVYPYSTHWFSIISNKTSQEAKSKDVNSENKGTNAEQMMEYAQPGTYMTVVYFPQVNVDGTPRLTITTKKEGSKEIEYANTSWGTYGGSAILAVSPLGTKKEREQQILWHEEAKEERDSGSQKPKESVKEPAKDPARGTAWGRPAPAHADKPMEEQEKSGAEEQLVERAEKKKPIWGKKVA